MRLGTLTIRLAALAVLLASFSDYWAYDRWDPAAPMNSCGCEAVSVFDFQAPSDVGLRGANLPDDHCACCSPIVAPPAPIVPRPALSTFPATCVAADIASTLQLAVAISVSPPLGDTASLGVPLRI